MIIFVVSLKSKQVSKSWESVCQFFERTIRPIFRQTDPNFQVIVVCHEKPKLQFVYPHIHYIKVDFPIPTDHYAKSVDRTRKIIAGMYHAQNFYPDHIMVVDADDCLNSNLVEFVNQYPYSNVWFIDRGYVYQEEGFLMYRKNRFFYAWYGTCNILKLDLCPQSASYGDYSKGIANFYDDHNHVNIPRIMSEQGTPSEAVPCLVLSIV